MSDPTWAVQENMATFRSLLGLLPGGERHDEPDLLWFATDIPHFIVNGVYRTRFATHEVDARIEQTLEQYRRRAVPAAWWVGPAEQPANLATRLLAHGLVHHMDVVGMVADVSGFAPPPVPDGLRIEIVGKPEMIRQHIRILNLPPVIEGAFYDLYADLALRRGYPWYRLLGFLDQEPVAVSEVYMADGVAGIYGVATLPWARRRGIGSAMIGAAMAVARQSGCHTAVLDAAEAALGLYRRLGFRDCCSLSNYLWTEAGRAE